MRLIWALMNGVIKLTASLLDVSTPAGHSLPWRLLHFVPKFRLSSADSCLVSESRSSRNMGSESLAFRFVHHLILIHFMRSFIIFSSHCFWCNTISFVLSYLRLFSSFKRTKVCLSFLAKTWSSFDFFVFCTFTYTLLIILTLENMTRLAAYEDRFGRIRLDFSGRMSVCMPCLGR